MDLDTLRSRIAELRNVNEDSGLGPEEDEKLLNDVAHELESKINWIFSESYSNLSSFSSEGLNELVGQLKNGLDEVEGENASIDAEIEGLQRTCVEDSDKMENELEKLHCSLELIQSQTLDKAKEDMQTDVSCLADDQAEFLNERNSRFKMLELSHQIEKSTATLKSLQDLDSTFKRFEAVEKIENAFTGLRVIGFEGNSIKLSLKTYIPYLETVLRQQDIENVIEPLEMNHELTIETTDGTCELKSVEILPNDVYISDIIDAAKSCSLQKFLVTETRSSLEFLVRTVQDRIALSALRRFMVKNANKSRHSFEYLDREDIILAHVVGGVDAFMKLPQGWPLSYSGLELISLKSTSQYSKEISLSFLCKIVEVANSLNPHLRRNLSSFGDSIEEILLQQMRAELEPRSLTAK